MRVARFLRRADESVQDAKTTVTLGVVVACAALLVATVAIVVAVRR